MNEFTRLSRFLFFAGKGNHGTIRDTDPIEYENRLRNFLMRKRFYFQGDF
ncbi:hypothetical protein [Leptospira adleri]|nr:hypothetical protein [Leptospira adleri]